MKWAIGNRAASVLYSYLMVNGLNGKRVVLPANVCYIVPITFFKAGCEVIFVDINENLGMKQQNIHYLVEHSQIDIVFWIKTYGIQNELGTWYKSLKRINPRIIIIEDCCLARPDLSENLDESVAIQLYSTGYAKYVQLGYGGFAKMQSCYNTAQLQGDYSGEALTEINHDYDMCLINKKAFTYADTNWLDLRRTTINQKSYFKTIEEEYKKIRQHKEKLNHIYRVNLPKEIQFPKGYHDWRFNILVDNKEQILAALKINNLFASSHYPSAYTVFTNEYFPEAEKLYDHVINLFNNNCYTEQMAYETTKIINELIK
ncbi:MAG: hypothetical protein AB9856_18520 [Cellulosilyticaceae bacterium]